MCFAPLATPAIPPFSAPSGATPDTQLLPRSTTPRHTFGSPNAVACERPPVRFEDSSTTKLTLAPAALALARESAAAMPDQPAPMMTTSTSVGCDAARGGSSERVAASRAGSARWTPIPLPLSQGRTGGRVGGASTVRASPSHAGVG